MSANDETLRSVRVGRVTTGEYIATNSNGVTISLGSGDEVFSPVELLLAAIGGCTAIDADVATSRHAEPAGFSVIVTGHKIQDDLGSRMTDLEVTFRVSFPEGAEGDAARAILPRAVQLSHDRLCTVSRTVEIGTPVKSMVAPEA
ncbi:MAG TPA: OsmC family protein [Actinocrinis sp.]|nr:OsmC family protein [Actinocrinis sp.]